MNHWTSEAYSAMENELEKFFDSSKKGNLKLFVDFDINDKKVEANPFEIESIKYKTKKVKKGSTLDLKSRNKKEDNSLF
jgi:hypothetical protein